MFEFYFCDEIVVGEAVLISCVCVGVNAAELCVSVIVLLGVNQKVLSAVLSVQGSLLAKQSWA